MPSPALYVFAVIAGVAAGLAFKELVYDPHLAPKVEEWTEAYATYRRERRRKRAAPHGHTHAHSDAEVDDHRKERKSSVELESMVEREMQNFDRSDVLRHRKNNRSNDHGVEMLEKPNVFLPFEPLSPRRTPSASPTSSNIFASRSDIALPIDRLPTPVSDRETAPGAVHLATSPQVSTIAPNTFAPRQSRAMHSPENASLSPSYVFESAFPESAPGSRASSRMAFEFEFVPPASADVIPSDSRSMTPFSDSRSTTYYTDAGSEASVDFLGSDSVSSDAELLYAIHSDAESFSSHAGSDSPPIHRSAEFAQAPPLDARSNTGSEDWECVSDAGR